MPFWCSWPRAAGDWTHVQSIEELFPDGCGPAANENLQAALEGRAPNAAHRDAIRAADIAAGRFRVGGGQTIGEVNANLQTWHLTGHTTLHDYAAHTLYSKTDVRAACERITYGDAAHPQGGLIVEVQAAYNWPMNEAGVHDHFGAVVGYDTLRDGIPRVLLCNGDVTPTNILLRPPQWITLDQLSAGQVIGMVEVYLQTPAPPPPPPPPPLDTLAVHTALARITAANAASDAAVQDILSALAKAGYN